MRVALLTLLASSLLVAAMPAPDVARLAPRTTKKSSTTTAGKGAATASGGSSKSGKAASSMASGSGRASASASGSGSAVPTYTGKGATTLSTTFPQPTQPATTTSGPPIAEKTHPSCPFKGVDPKQADKNGTLEDLQAALKKQNAAQTYIKAKIGAAKKHPRANAKIKKLYLGTSSDSASALATSIKEARLPPGDVTPGPFTEAGWPGLYLTNSLSDAAAWARWYNPDKPISVLELSWDPVKFKSKVKELDDRTQKDKTEFELFQLQNLQVTARKLMYRSGQFDMISGPTVTQGANGIAYGTSSWTYAITNPKGLKGLQVLGTLELAKCEENKMPKNSHPYGDTYKPSVEEEEEAEPEAEPEQEPEADQQPEGGPEPDSPAPDSNPAPDTKPDTTPDTKPDAPEPKPDTKPDPKPDADPADEPKTTAKPKPDAATDADSEPTGAAGDHKTTEAKPHAAEPTGAGGDHQATDGAAKPHAAETSADHAAKPSASAADHSAEPEPEAEGEAEPEA